MIVPSLRNQGSIAAATLRSVDVLFLEGLCFLLERYRRWCVLNPECLCIGGRLTSILGKTLENVAWYYKEPYEKAKSLKDYIAFCKSTLGLITLFTRATLVSIVSILIRSR